MRGKKRKQPRQQQQQQQQEKEEEEEECHHLMYADAQNAHNAMEEQAQPLLVEGERTEDDDALRRSQKTGGKGEEGGGKVHHYLGAGGGNGQGNGLAAADLGTFDRWVHALYGDLDRGDIWRIGWLSMTLFVIIGGFWLLDSLKDTVLERTVGMEYQPRAKLISVLITFLLVLQYNKLIDTVAKPVLFYVIGAFYTVVFACVGALLGTSIGMENADSHPSRLIGWVSYVAIESYGSLAVALFWAFCNSSVNLSEAKSSYGLIIAGAQIGAILGSTGATLTTQSKDIHVYQLYMGGCLSPCLMMALVWGYVRLFDSNREQEEQGGDMEGVTTAVRGETARSTSSVSIISPSGVWESAMEGLKMVIGNQYLLLLLGISCLYEVVLTVLDYEMKVIGVATFRTMDASDEADEGFATLMGRFGQATNSLSLLFSLFGTSYVVRRFGVQRTLRLFPTLLIVAVVFSYFQPKLWMFFVCVSVLKALTYSLNEPCKEMLYLPTTQAVKFKAKGWIDVFGARCAKGLGSFITESTRRNPKVLLTYGSLASFAVACVLLIISLDIGAQFTRLIASGGIVGEDDHRQLGRSGTGTAERDGNGNGYSPVTVPSSSLSSSAAAGGGEGGEAGGVVSKVESPEWGEGAGATAPSGAGGASVSQPEEGGLEMM